MNEFYITGNENSTLVDALQKHYSINPQFTPWNKYKSSIAKRLVKAHDTMHILFGCDTSLLGEMRVQIWTKYASPKFTLKQKIEFLTDRESLVLLMNPVGYFAMGVFFFKHIQELKKAKKQAKYLKKVWIYFDTEAYEHKTIASIREEFGIKVISD
jgi:hypothetical protein